MSSPCLKAVRGTVAEAKEILFIFLASIAEIPVCI